MGEPPNSGGQNVGGSHGVGYLGSQNPTRRLPALSTPSPPAELPVPVSESRFRTVFHIFRRVHAVSRFALCLVTVFRVVRVLQVSIPYLQYPVAGFHLSPAWRIGDTGSVHGLRASCLLAVGQPEVLSGFGDFLRRQLPNPDGARPGPDCTLKFLPPGIIPR